MTPSFPIAGVSLDSYSKGATWVVSAGAQDANYPVANLGNLRIPSQVGRFTPAANNFAVSAQFFDAPKDVRLVALVGHTIAAAAKVRVRLFSDTAETVNVYDTGSLAVWPPGADSSAGYKAVRPILLPQAVTCSAVRVDIDGSAAAADIGAIEVSKFWEWPGISPGSVFGFRPRGQVVEIVGGASEGTDEYLGRTYDGQIDLLAYKIAATTGLDFQKLKSLTAPFVFAEDFDDPTTWPRTCFLATNAELPPLVGAVYRHDTFQFRLREHLR